MLASQLVGRRGGSVPAWVATILVTSGALSAAAAASAAEFTVERSEQGAVVKLDGQLVTEYLVQSGHKPVLWPLVGPTGKPLTRSYPVRDEPAETHDHLHHRSLWFMHGKVNGIDFWTEAPKNGVVRHREFVELHGGAEGRIVTLNDWLTFDGKKVCEDRRTFVFRAAPERRIIDVELVVAASEGPLTFGDTKDGGFGVRVADWMAVDAHKGGRIINSEGHADAAAFGRRAAWTDYNAPSDGQTVGIAILNHPSSYGFPTYWFVRTYGLFAANPFGRKAYEGAGAKDGSLTIEAGHSFTLRYRILLHVGDEKSAKIAEAFAQYAKESFGSK